MKDRRGVNQQIHDFHIPYSIEPIADPEVLLKGGEEFTFGDTTVKCIHSPGHSEGSCLLLMKDHAVFCGDVLFQGSVGRTDLIGGSNSQMVQTLRMIKEMDPELIFYPGHGPRTTLKEELNGNYYLLTV